ncbi:MAG: hypothetical protein ACLP6G_01810 [Terriglobales bacterium]
MKRRTSRLIAIAFVFVAVLALTSSAAAQHEQALSFSGDNGRIRREGWLLMQ